MADNFHWKRIRALNGSQSSGFEELCAQLALEERPTDSEFRRKGSPDAGIECFCILRGGSEWGWQAKFFDTLKNPQWSQLNESVKKALDKHPALVRYYVCIPLNRADPRVAGKEFAMDLWHKHVRTWESWAQERNMEVEFEWWGSTELLDMLTQEKNIGRRFFWFGDRGFSKEWFKGNLKLALDSAGPRYTPPIHVDLPVALDMERFGGSGLLVEEVKFQVPGIRRALSFLASAAKALEDSPLRVQLEGFLSEGSNVLGDISDLCATPIGRHPFPEIAQAAEEAISTGYEVTEQLLSMLREKRLHSQESQSPKASYEKTLRDSYRSVQNLQWTLGEVAETCIRAHSLGNKQLLLLRGAGGTGKTHLLCDFAKKRVQAGLPTVILMGHRFLGNDEPWVQLLQQLDLAGTTAKEFVGALESAAQVCNCRALVIVDALNEGNGRILWPAHLASLVARLQESPWIGVILSVRSSYEDLVIKESVRDQAHVTTHPGFQGHTRPPTSF